MPFCKSVGAGLILLVLSALSSCSTPVGKVSDREIIVAAAADLGPAFEEIKTLFEHNNDIKLTFIFGSTGTLTQQIENGAPVDLFAAANVEFIDRLERVGLIVPETKTLYARGRITIWERADGRLRLQRIEDLAKPEVRRIAIANPEHAPYGAAAREALQTAGVWNEVQPKLVLGENVRQTLQFAETGNCDVAIAALSLSVPSSGRWVLIPQELHKPLDQALAVTRRGKRESEARRFAEFINGPLGRPVMRKYGFVLPGEEPN